MKAVEKHFFCLVFIFLFNLSFAQQAKIDSISNLLKNYHSNTVQPSINDTTKVNYLNALAWQLSYENSDTALELSKDALHLAEKVITSNQDPLLTRGIKIGLGTSYYQIGSFYDDKDDYSLSMQSYSQALNLCEELLTIDSPDKTQTRVIKKLKATILGNIGIVYRKQSDYPKSMDFYFQALKLDEELGMKKEIATDLGNIGVVYYRLKNYPKTLDYYQRALKIDEALGNKTGVARHLGNIGGVYAEQEDYVKALDYYFKALKMSEDLKSKGAIARHLGNIGSVYFREKDNVKALDYLLRSLKIKEELGAKSLIVTGLRSIGVLYTTTKKYPEAKDYLERSLAMAEKLGGLDDIKECHICLRDLYKGTGDYAKALEHFQIAMNVKDSIFDSDKDKEITRKEMTYEYEKKDAASKATQEKKDVLSEANAKKQKLILIFVSGGLFLVFVCAGLIFRALKVTRRQKKLIEEKNKQTEEQKKVIELQKEIVEEKNKDIIDSINYAKRIQDALLKEEDYVSDHLPDHFVLYKPKDIVSGDFYWSIEKGKRFYLAAVDCTGHGVPGAFMSMLGIAFLNEINASDKLFSPAEILNHLRDKVVKEFRQSGRNQETNDGMDMSIVRLNLDTNELEWAGANNPLYIIKKGELSELKPDKQCIGYNDNMQPFVNHTMKLETGNAFYLFTDGYADQFGGEKGKKFKYSKLKEILLSIQNKSLVEQKQILSENFENWKGKLEQVDDVCVIGVRI
jgi:serine phosphatase RsbU (regulator of sigma subunit)/Tfp pilus assembly protein PilF